LLFPPAFSGGLLGDLFALLSCLAVKLRKAGMGMDLFGQKKRQKERTEMDAERVRMQTAITKLSARLNCVEALLLAIITNLDAEQKKLALSAAKQFVTELGTTNPPDYVQKGNEQLFRDELSRSLQIFIGIVP
jgi:hypothetical protein